MAKPKRKWPRMVAMVLVATLLTGGLALVLVDKFAPTQTYIPQQIVKLPSTIVSTLMRPMQGAFAAVTGGVRGYLETLKLRKTIEIEYNKLKAQNDALIYDTLYTQELEDRLARLEDLLKVYRKYEAMNPIAATVTEKETGNWFQMFTIDKGSKHDIERDMAVVNNDGLIGYIYKVEEESSQVISIVDSRAGVSGIIQSSRDQGVVRGSLGVDNEATCRMYYLPVDQVPRPDDTVETSGIGMPFPKGIGIGKVRESTKYMEENKQYVVIEPFVDFQHIEEVIVLVYKPDAEAMPDDNDGQAAYVAQPLDTYRPVPPLDVARLDDEDLGAVTPPPRAPREGSGWADMPEADQTAEPTARVFSRTAGPDAMGAPAAESTSPPPAEAPGDADMEEQEAVG